MSTSRNKTLVTVFVTIAATLVVGIVGAVAVAYSGAVDVSAAKPTTGILRWFLVTTRRHSVAAHSTGIKVPNLDAPGMVELGADHYKEMCVTCHGAPGVEPDEAPRGLDPPAPRLYKGPPMTNERAARTFWIIKHGIRMSGMPAIGKTHSDHKIWAMVAFLKKLHGMSPAAYQKAVASTGHDDEGDHDHAGH